MAEFDRWKAPEIRTTEDKLLYQYWQRVGGIIFTEVIIGGRAFRDGLPSKSSPRRIDGVRIIPSSEASIGPAEIVTFSTARVAEFTTYVNYAHIEIIEVKTVLNRFVIGQAIVGSDLLELVTKPTTIKPVIVCRAGDPLLELVCEKRGIMIWMPQA